MSDSSRQRAVAHDRSDETLEARPPGHRRRWLIAGLIILVLAAAGVALVLTDSFGGGSRAVAGVQDNAYPTALVSITQQDLSSQNSVSGTLGYAGTHSVIDQAQGIYTALPKVGQIVRSGQVLCRLDGAPVLLLGGHTAAYRSLSQGMSGADVKELNTDLVALGYATASQLDPTSNYFGSETFYALERLQLHFGLTETGSLPLGQAIFLPAPLRIIAVAATLGAAAGPGSPLGQATSTERQVAVALDAAAQSQVQAGDKVVITLPDKTTTPGIVTSVGRVATSSGDQNGSTTIPVYIRPLKPRDTGTLDQAPVQVSITTASVKNALVVPVAALLALSGGGYAVEVVGASGVHSLVPVSLGLFDDADGLVQVSGSGLSAGQHVVVPAS